ncbi:GHMP kinase [Rugamonas rubra]|jgi:D-glycero-alpha-D-manno-heptose-7-phosphate kinase|uniref:D-glycero-alpha-D-manno-heptose-7-phosphate kinase n=1 Tax=Rugamonas rubra TaxID=758825 RepID=A0A1I4N0G1_9BURK|nr:GHMP kinase [Rugamonas rubra]SFM08865.1 D-glycero-alpha-D-manno-heptose-7-phosphate kinase [Rugamonas rubra]
MLIVSRTPLRVSFFGGGTDYPEYFEEHGGAVLGLAIDKYIYLAALRLSGIQAYNFRLSYSKVEHLDEVGAIEHLAVRAAFQHYRVEAPLDISVMADMPANSGLGSSSAFSVGLLNLIAHLNNENVTKLDLALRAIHLEHDLLRENVGVQDQLHAAFGGINRFDFDGKRYRITPMAMRGECQQHLLRSMLLVHTGIARHASEVVDEQLRRTRGGAIDAQLGGMMGLVEEAAATLLMGQPETMLRRLGAMLDEGWRLKRSISPYVSTPAIDELYAKAKRLGALGGKLCGAGGGGFLLVLVPPEERAAFIERIAPARVISIGLDTEGTKILYR